MAKIKPWKKENRVFMNAYDKSCDSVLFWRVEVYQHFNPKKSTKAQWSAEICLPANGGSIYASTKAGLRPLRTFQQELNKVNDAVEEAIRRCEEHNG